jgi:hypothetical protein
MIFFIFYFYNEHIKSLKKSKIINFMFFKQKNILKNKFETQKQTQ